MKLEHTLPDTVNLRLDNDIARENYRYYIIYLYYHLHKNTFFTFLISNQIIEGTGTLVFKSSVLKK